MRPNKYTGGYKRSASLNTQARNSSCRQIGERGRATAQRIDTGACTRVQRWITRQRVQRPRQPVGGGLVAGDEEREDLVAHLLVAHAGAVALVARFEQVREQVLRALAAAPALVDHALHALVEQRDRQRSSRLRASAT